jgi:hypothetical protein
MDIIVQIAICCQQLGTKEDLGYDCVINAYIPIGLNVIIVVYSAFNECFLFFWMEIHRNIIFFVVYSIV